MEKRIFAVLLVLAMLAAAGCGKKTKITLGDYKGLALTRVSQETVEREIQNVLEQAAEQVEVSRPAELGDTVNINYMGMKDGEAFEGGTDDSESGTNLELGSNRFIDGFEDGLVGVSAGETVFLNLTFPDPYDNNPALAGQPVVFQVTVNKVLETVIPELDDKFVQENSEYQTVAEYKQGLRDSLDKNSFYTQISQALMASSEAQNLPEDEIAEEKDKLVDYYTYFAELYAQYYGVDAETALYYFYGFESLDALNTWAQETAVDLVKSNYVLKEIAKQEKIEVSDEIFNERAAEYAKEYNAESVEAFLEQYGEEAVREVVLSDLVVEFCIDNAVIMDAE